MDAIKDWSRRLGLVVIVGLVSYYLASNDLLWDATPIACDGTLVGQIPTCD